MKEEYFDLGMYSRLITTKHPAVQIHFDCGLIWSYGFNHLAAIWCFERAIEIDPDCAMAYWGLAYALGPNYNKPWEVFDKEDLARTITKAAKAATQAVQKSTHSNLVEQALCKAVQFRYQESTSADDASQWNQDYADAMGEVYARYGNDLDVAALYADALMNLTPWALWDISTGKPAEDARTEEIKHVLEKAISSEGGLEHPGLLHLYIHLMEMSNTPETAMTAANCLRTLVPDAGHLNHMPTHLDLLCGDYMQAIKWNSNAILADEKYLAKTGPLNFYTLYRCHNYHFRVYAAMFAGQCQVAIDTARQLESSLPEELLRVESPPMADWLEGFLSIKLHVYVRFGKWQAIIDLPLPEDKDLFCVTTAMIHYARGVAFAATKRISQAIEEQNQLTAAIARVPKSRTLFNNTCLDILAVAAAMLEGELAYRVKKFDRAFDHLRHAIQLEDTLPYDEPWGWMQPSRHAYGALLLEQGHIEEASRVYEADLGLDDTLPRALHHPNNIWALHGYHECLERLGRTSEAKLIAHKLQTAVAATDVSVHSSCYCRNV